MDSLTLRITNEAKMPERRALVRIEHWTIPTGFGQSKLQSTQATYDKATELYTAKLQPGIYDIFISRYGLLPFCQRIEIKSGKQTAIQVELKFGSETHLIH
jgi:hypothetical protein